MDIYSIPNDSFKNKIIIEQDLISFYEEFFKYYPGYAKINQQEENINYIKDHKDYFFNEINKDNNVLANDFLWYCKEGSLYNFFHRFGIKALKYFFIEDKKLEFLLKEIEKNYELERKFLSDEEFKLILLEDLKDNIENSLYFF